MTDITKFKCSSCLFKSLNKENVEKHIKQTNRCTDAHIVEIEIKCEICDKQFLTELSKNNHENICKTGNLDELKKFPMKKQNEILKEKYNNQNKYILIMEEQILELQQKIAREEEINNMPMQNEYGLSANEMHGYCMYTLKRLYKNLTLPAIAIGLEMAKLNVDKQDKQDDE